MRKPQFVACELARALSVVGRIFVACSLASASSVLAPTSPANFPANARHV